MRRHGSTMEVHAAVKGVKVAAVVLVVAAMSGCSSSVVFEDDQNTLHLNAGTYAVAVADECGTPIATVVTNITTSGWSYPLLSGMPLTIPSSGEYMVGDEIGSDLMATTPACSLALRIALTPLKP